MGHGVVYHNGVRALETGYDLTVTPPARRGDTFESGEPGGEPGRGPDITGRLLGSLYDAESFTGTATLVLEDGRALDFRVIQPDTNEIVGIGWFRSPDSSTGHASVTDQEG